jgi:protein AroM
VISKTEVTRRIQAHLDYFAGEKIRLTLMFCTGAFKGLIPRSITIFPSSVLTRWVEAILPEGRLGIFTPLPAQIQQVKSKWAQGRWEVVVEPLLPVDSTPELGPAAERMVRQKPDLIVLDCMGYTPWMKSRIQEITQIHSVLAVTAAARVVQELMT